MGVHVHIGTMVLVEVAVVGVKRERRRRPNWLLQVALKWRLRHTDFRGLGLSVLSVCSLDVCLSLRGDEQDSRKNSGHSSPPW